ncbi:response regulator receiver protein [Richelia sinica FACHB-800]|uniref:Response regulator receiver protein n=1 Tax=Richelia sinica FACHB-800 TaxID=1357546 RepID=A0A975T5B3_9NOST|nr:response regulator transcription factor [Richelia sinica]MBD2662903.1 response regulator transcription factor [Richelia sinica FACHB-800]QXE21743.1 response regulator receiver protein [Richelia sinica FACHB-800]
MLMLSPKSAIVRVLIVDDHDLTRYYLKVAFSAQENIQLVGLATNGEEAIEMVKSCHPHVIVLDLQMPVMDGWIASGKIKAISPHIQIVAYSSIEESRIKQTKAMPSFDEVCKKDIPTSELIAIVRELGLKAEYD